MIFLFHVHVHFYNNLSYADWDMKLQQTMVELFSLKSADAAYSKVSGMLATLGDPFTRIISPKVGNVRDHMIN